MKVDNFFFSWQHNSDRTSCFVYMNPPDGRLKDADSIVMGVSKLNPKDHYDNQIGRKTSLLRALQELSKKKLINDEFRVKAWEVYRTMTKVPRWEKKD